MSLEKNTRHDHAGHADDHDHGGGVHPPHPHDHHDHDDHDHPHSHKVAAGDVLVIRPSSGLSGDMILAGLARMAGLDSAQLGEMAAAIGLPALNGSVRLEQRAVSGVNGWTCLVSLPHEHAHRSLTDVRAIIGQSRLTPNAARLADATFTLLAEAEGRVHNVAADQVTFHEVGALDSILDICLSAALFDRLAPAAFVCGPLPLCDGAVRCAHGLLPTPAPAVLELLEGVPIRGIDSVGETVTPTAIALLKGLGATFGLWPAMTVARRALVYGTRVLPGVPNGAVFAWGKRG